MKCCFLFTHKANAEKLSAFLKNELKGEVKLDSYIGYPTIYVQDEEYETAIIKGSRYAVDNSIGSWWLDIDQRRVNITYVPIAYAEVFKECKLSDGSWKTSTTNQIKALTKLASKAMHRKVIFEKTPCNDVRFYIERTDEELHKFQYAHREMFSFIFARSVQNVVFRRAVLCDYFGKHVFQIKDVEDLGEWV